MPRLIQADIGNLAPRELTFAMPAVKGEASTLTRLDDGSVIFDAVPLVANQGMLYYPYEVPTDGLFGLTLWWEDTPAPKGCIRYDTELIGFLTIECAENMLDQFEGLGITDNHIDIEPGYREDVAVGTFLRNAVLDGDLVRTRALIYNASAIIKIDANGSELSIGGMAYMAPNPDRGAAGEPDFFIKRINLNHVALVEYGRAGPEARLLNQRANLAHKKEVPHMKVTINGVEIEVPDVAVNHYAAVITTLTAQVESATTTAAEVANSVTTLTAERDSALGAVTAAQAELTAANDKVTTLTNATPDVTVEAARIANEHTAFAAEAARLGHADELVLGAYDRSTVMLTVLNARGATFDATANADHLGGAWSFAIANAAAGNKSVLDVGKPASFTAPLANVATSAQEAINASYFGAGKKKEA